MNRFIEIGLCWLFLAMTACSDDCEEGYAEDAKVSFGYARQRVVENATPLRIPVVLSSPVGRDVTVTGCVKKEMNAKEGKDYTFRSKQIVIQAGESVGYFEVEIEDYFEWMPERIFEFELVESSGATLSSQDICRIVICSDEGLPEIGFSETLLRLGEDVREVELEVGLSRPFDREAEFRVHPLSGRGDAVYGKDYQLDTLNIFTIPAGEQTVKIKLEIIDDITDNGDRSFELALCDCTNSVLSAVYQSVKIYVLDDEEPVFVNFSKTEIVGIEGDTVWIPVKVVGTHKSPVEVGIRATEGKGLAVEGKDFRFLRSELVFPVGCWGDSIPVELIDNENKQAVRNFRLGFSSVQGALAAEKDTSVTVSINDEDFDYVELYDRLMGEWIFIAGEGSVRVPEEVSVYVSGGDTPEEEDENYLKYLVVQCDKFGENKFPARWRLGYDPKDGSLSLVLGEIFVKDVPFTNGPVDLSWRRWEDKDMNDLTPIPVFHNKDYSKLEYDPTMPVRAIGIYPDGQAVWWLTMKNCIMVRSK